MVVVVWGGCKLSELSRCLQMKKTMKKSNSSSATSQIIKIKSCIKRKVKRGKKQNKLSSSGGWFISVTRRYVTLASVLSC